jgi:hypothetical protein
MNRVVGAGLAALLALALACPAVSAEKLVDLKRVFVHLDAYWKTPPAERTRFTVVYRMGKAGGGAVSGLKVWIVEGAKRTPLGIGADGRPERLPTLEEFEHAKLALDAPAATKFAVALTLEPLERPAPEMDAQDLVIAATQATAAVRKAEGLLGGAMPANDQVYFAGVASGEAVWPDGRRKPLEVRHKMPVFDSTAEKGARTLRFPHAPTQVEIGPK